MVIDDDGDGYLQYAELVGAVQVNTVALPAPFLHAVP